jgi:hypothetical protein
MYLVGANIVGFSTASTRRAYIDSVGTLGVDNNAEITKNLGIGGVNFGSWDSGYRAIQIGSSSFSGSLSSATGNAQTFLSSNAYVNGSVWKYLNASAACQVAVQGVTPEFNFNYAAAGAAGGTITWSTAMNINSSGGVKHLNAISVGNATPTTSGAGITFPATQSASTDANTLDDYEEGTWTPVVAGDSTAGTATYTTQVGRYTKIGNAVSVQMQVTWSAGTGTGTLLIVGLPFTTGSFNPQSLSPGQVNNIALAANNVLTLILSASSTTIGLQQYPVGGGAPSAVSYDAAGQLLVSGTYFV